MYIFDIEQQKCGQSEMTNYSEEGWWHVIVTLEYIVMMNNLSYFFWEVYSGNNASFKHS